MEQHCEETFRCCIIGEISKGLLNAPAVPEARPFLSGSPGGTLAGVHGSGAMAAGTNSCVAATALRTVKNTKQWSLRETV